MTASDHDDHLRYLQRCEEGHIHGTVLTPYLNFMYGGRITYLTAILEHGGFNVLPDSNGLVYVLDAPWRERIFDSDFDSPHCRSSILTQTQTLEENSDPSN